MDDFQLPTPNRVEPTMRNLFAAIFFFCLTTCIIATEHVIVVAPKPFHQSLDPWQKYRTAQDYTIHLVTPSPEATPEQIKERIVELAKQTPISAILLVGNAVLRERQGTSGGVVPTQTMASQSIQDYGGKESMASDSWYADFDDDGVPDAAIGRFAVATPQELDHLIGKTIRYEKQQPEVWCRNLELTTGDGHFSPFLDQIIESATRTILTNFVPNHWHLELIHLNWRSRFSPFPPEIRDEMVRSLKRESLFWVYVGHGHPQRLEPYFTPLGNIRTLHCQDVEEQFWSRKQSTDARPIAVLLCCHTGAMDAPRQSFGEALVASPEGPVAALAASQLTTPYGMAQLGVELLQEISRNTQFVPQKASRVTFGAVVLAAKRNMLQNNMLKRKDDTEISADGKRQQKPHQIPIREQIDLLAQSFDPHSKKLTEQLEDHVHLFNIFGDPLLALPIPNPITLQCTVNRQAATVEVKGELERNSNVKTVLVEMLPALDSMTLTDPSRTEFRVDPESEKEYRDTFSKANDRVLFRQTVSVVDDRFSVEIPVRKSRHKMIVRVFGQNGAAAFAGGTEGPPFQNR